MVEKVNREDKDKLSDIKRANKILTYIKNNSHGS